jgi:hypothetical protein
MHQWVKFTQLELTIINLGFKTNVALLSLWVWVKVEKGLGVAELQSIIMTLLISLLDAKLVLTHDSHISLDWNFQSLQTHTPRVAHATLSLLGFGGVGSLEWRMFFISVVILAIFVLMTLCPRTKQLAHNFVSVDSSVVVMALEEFTIWMRLVYFIVPNQMLKKH